MIDNLEGKIEKIVIVKQHKNVVKIAEDDFDPKASGLWAQHASTAPL